MPDTPADDVWFRDGLRFTCTQCGKCCTGDPGYVWVTDDEVRRLAAFRDEDEREFREMHTRTSRGKRTLRERANGDCVLFDAKKGCTVYPVRPAQCRTWPFWDSNLETRADWEETERACPGSGEGELIPVEEIGRRMKVIKM